MTWTNAPVCERCWFEREGEWKPIDDVADQLVSIRMPVRLAEPTLERCGFCGAPTISGIYQRADVPMINVTRRPDRFGCLFPDGDLLDMTQSAQLFDEDPEERARLIAAKHPPCQAIRIITLTEPLR